MKNNFITTCLAKKMSTNSNKEFISQQESFVDVFHLVQNFRRFSPIFATSCGKNSYW